MEADLTVGINSRGQISQNFDLRFSKSHRIMGDSPVMALCCLGRKGTGMKNGPLEK